MLETEIKKTRSSDAAELPRTEAPCRESDSRHPTDKGPPGWEYAVAVVASLILPAVNGIGLGYIYTYYAGDIEHPVLPVATYYIIQGLSALLPYFALAVPLRSTSIRGGRRSMPLYIIAGAGMLIPYVSPALLELLLGTSAKSYSTYLGYAGLWLFDLLVFAVSLLTVTLFGAKRQKHSKSNKAISRSELRNLRESAGMDAQGKARSSTAKDSRGEATRSTAAGRIAEAASGAPKGTRERTVTQEGTTARMRRRRAAESIPSGLRKGINASVLIRLSIGIITEIYYAALFFYSLANEYYRSPYASELLVMAGLFLLQAVYALAGWLIIRETVIRLDKKERKLNDECN